MLIIFAVDEWSSKICWLADIIVFQKVLQMNSTLLQVKYLLVNRLILMFYYFIDNWSFCHQNILLSMAVLTY